MKNNNNLYCYNHRGANDNRVQAVNVLELSVVIIIESLAKRQGSFQLLLKRFILALLIDYHRVEKVHLDIIANQQQRHELSLWAVVNSDPHQRIPKVYA